MGTHLFHAFEQQVRTLLLTPIRPLLFAAGSAEGIPPVQASCTYPSVDTLHLATSFQSSHASMTPQGAPYMQIIPGYVYFNIILQFN